MLRRSTVALVTILAALATACGGSSSPAPEAKPDAFVEAVPTASALTFKVDLLAGGFAVQKATISDQAVAALAEYSEVEETKAATGLVNRTLEVVGGLVPETTPAVVVDATTKSFGPVPACVVKDAGGLCVGGGDLQARLVVKQRSELAYSWRLQVRATGSTDESAWQNAFAGKSEIGDVAHSGEGQVFVDLDVISAVAPSFTGRGDLFAGFKSGSAGKSLIFRAKRIGFDGVDPVTTTLYATQAVNGPARVRLARAIDVLPGPRGGELTFSWLGWKNGVGGKAFTIISNWRPGTWAGDVPFQGYPLENYLVTRSCFGADAKTLYRESFLCSVAQLPGACMADNQPTRIAGADGASFDSACAFVPAGAETAAPATSYDSPYVETAEPELPAPPAPPSFQADVLG